GMHGPTDISPVGMAAAMHLGLSIHNFGIQEYMFHSEQILEVFPRDYEFRAGRLHVGDKPGHGVELDEKLAARYPYVPRQLPVARLEDGAMWDW
ncbi:enolase C-terminal domain-like protein, partial [Halomonas sp. SIMBA_159]